MPNVNIIINFLLRLKNYFMGKREPTSVSLSFFNPFLICFVLFNISLLSSTYLPNKILFRRK